jgi:protein involved in sex pheromone biosynthesis
MYNSPVTKKKNKKALSGEENTSMQSRLLPTESREGPHLTQNILRLREIVDIYFKNHTKHIMGRFVMLNQWYMQLSLCFKEVMNFK